MPAKDNRKTGGLAMAACEEVRAEMARKNVTGKDLAARIGRSQNYLATRLRGEVSFSMNDLEDISTALGVPPSVIIDAALASHRAGGRE